MSEFLHPQDPDDFTKSDTWKEMWEIVLDEQLANAINRFIKEGLIAPSDLENTLSYKLKVAELKDLLRQRDLPFSGRKDDLIKQIVTANTPGM